MLSKKEAEELERLYNEVNKGAAKPDVIATPEGFYTKSGFYPYSKEENKES